MNTPAGVALVGAGFISYFHVIAIRHTSDLRLVAVASRSRRIAEHRGRLFGAAAYTFDELPLLLARPDVDVVIVGSPVFLHAAHTRQAIAAGKHVVIEKPMMRTIAEAEDIVATADRSGVVVGYAENQVFTPLAVTARASIADGAVGRVQRVRAVFKHGGPPRGTWFWDPRFAGGGVHLDLGSHALETALYLAGKPDVRRVRSCEMQYEDTCGLDLLAHAVMETADGIEVETECSWTEPNDLCFYEVTGDRGVLRATFAPAPQALTIRGRGTEERSVDVPGQFDLRVDSFMNSLGYTGQLDHFARCFRNGETPSESAADGARVLRTLAAAYLAAARGRPVEVGDVPIEPAPIELLTGKTA